MNSHYVSPRRILPALLAGLLLLLPSARAAEPCLESLRLNTSAITQWSLEEKECGFRNLRTLWRHKTAKAAAPEKVLPLPARKALDLPDADAFMQSNAVWGMLILHRGTVLLEKYRGAFGPDQRWASFSMAKSITSTLVGIALREGVIKSLDVPVTSLLPELAGSAYEGVTLRQMLWMSSGVRWDETYLDTASNVAKLRNVSRTYTGGLLGYMASLPRAVPPGTHFNYNTGEAHLIGRFLSRATGVNLAEYLSQKIWRPYGMEADAFWNTDPSGTEISGCCFNATLRDYGRFGLFMLNQGKLDTADPLPGQARYLPKGWVKEATTAGTDSQAQGRPYGYQWWIARNGAYQASGVYGQMVHIDPQRDLVVVMLSARAKPTGERELNNARFRFLNDVKAKLDKIAALP